MAEEPQSDILVKEFEDLLQEIVQAVSKDAVLPAVKSAQEQWTERLSTLAGSLQDNQQKALKDLGDSLTRFNAALQDQQKTARLASDVLTSAKQLCKSVDDANGLLQATSGAVRSIDTGMQSFSAAAVAAKETADNTKAAIDCAQNALDDLQTKADALGGSLASQIDAASKAMDGILKDTKGSQDRFVNQATELVNKLSRKAEESQELLRKVTVAESAIAQAVKGFLAQATSAEQSLQQATINLEASCQSTRQQINEAQTSFTNATVSASVDLNSTLKDITAMEKDFSAKTSAFSKKFVEKLDATQTLLDEAMQSFEESQKPVVWGLTPRAVLASIFISNVLLWIVIVVLVVLRLVAGVVT